VCLRGRLGRADVRVRHCQNALAGAQGGWFPELFTAARRASGASLAYQISAMVSGFTPFVTTLLYVWIGWIGPGLLFSLYALIGLIAALLTRETFGRQERLIAAQAADPVPVSVDHPLPDRQYLAKESR
jgi:MHS family shikimate/dehydroshikimate transporter-like MFS transporter